MEADQYENIRKLDQIKQPESSVERPYDYDKEYKSKQKVLKLYIRNQHIEPRNINAEQSRGVESEENIEADRKYTSSGIEHQFQKFDNTREENDKEENGYA